MAFTMTTRGLYYFMNNAITGSTAFRMAVFKGTVPATSAIKDMDFLNDVTTAGMTEAAASGYSRRTLSAVTLTENLGSDNVTLTATTPALTTVAAGEVWTAVAYYVEGASDAARPLIGIDVPTPTTLTTNGADITLPQLSITIS